MQRQQIIESLMTQHAAKGDNTAIGLWEQMATQIVAIAGEGGFNSLYMRSLHLAGSTFPWLVVDLPLQGPRFAGLKKSLGAQPPTVAGVANSLLLITFTDLLATLVGEQLTARILNSAWDHALDRAGKEFNNE